MRGTVEINRVAPDAIDPMYSTKGHEPTISSARLRSKAGLDWWMSSEAEVRAFLAEHAPELDPDGPKSVVIAPEGGDDRHYYFLNGRDRRGYFTHAYVQLMEVI